MGAAACKPCADCNNSKVATIVEAGPTLEKAHADAAADLASDILGPGTDGLPSPSGKAEAVDEATSGSDSSVFRINLKRPPDMNIGLNLDALDTSTAFVDSIVPGAVQEWNEKNPPEQQLMVYDRIVAVNSVRGDSEKLLDELKKTMDWNLELMRPSEIPVNISCSKYPSLGLDLKYSPNGQTLLISSLGDGAITHWNATAQEKVQRNDRIVCINGVRGTARALLDAASSVDMLELKILHYSPLK